MVENFKKEQQAIKAQQNLETTTALKESERIKKER